jgi:hypothetical protein
MKISRRKHVLSKEKKNNKTAVVLGAVKKFKKSRKARRQKETERFLIV